MQWQLYLLVAICMSALVIFYQIIKLLWPFQPDDQAVSTKQLASASNGTYKGDYNEHGQYHSSHATFEGTNGDTYTGSFENGQFSGDGVYQYGNKSVARYEGQFHDGQFEGYGKEWYVDGSSYEGQFSGGHRHGAGKITYPKPAVKGTDLKYALMYEGDWKNGLKHGTGKLLYNDKSLYVGSFANGKREGRGEIVDAAGVRKLVNYREGKMYYVKKREKKQTEPSTTTPDKSTADAEQPWSPLPNASSDEHPAPSTDDLTSTDIDPMSPQRKHVPTMIASYEDLVTSGQKLQQQTQPQSASKLVVSG